MNITESISSAVASVLANKMRSILTMLGIIIGVAAVIALTSIGMGFKNDVQGEFASMGMDGLQVSIKSGEELKNSDYLTMVDMDTIMTHPNVSFTAPSIGRSASAILKNPQETGDVVAIGTNQQFRHVQNVEIKEGRFLIDNDVTNKTKVAIIDENLSKKVFGRVNSVGEKISIKFAAGTLELTVVGVSKSEEMNAMFGMPAFVYMPVTTMMDFNNYTRLDSIFVMTNDKDRMNETALELNRLLEVNHQSKDVYSVQMIMQGIDTLYSVLDGLTLFVGVVGFVSVIVGGIGVMNIMLVTVTERTREIGIRKSLGATDGNITFQFLIEAIILTVIGGIIGIIVGYLGGMGIGALADIKPYVSAPVVLGVVFISTLIGVIFGVYPAQKAAKLDPIEALRYE